MKLKTKKKRRLLPSLAASPFLFCLLAITLDVAGFALDSHNAGTVATGDANTLVVVNPAVAAARPLEHHIKQADAKEQESSDILDF